MDEELIDIYCPKCKQRGKKKLLGKVKKGTKGKLYLWCKEDKQEIEIELDEIELDEIELDKEP